MKNKFEVLKYRPGLIFLSIIGILILLPLSVVLLSDIARSVFFLFKAVVLDETAGINAGSYLKLLFKVFGVSILGYIIFSLFSLLLSVISCITYQMVAKDYHYKEYPFWDSIKRGMSWNFYRAGFALYPLFIVLLSTVALIAVFISLFNIYLLIAGISIGFVTFISSLIGLSLIFAFGYSLILSLLNLSTTLFGIDSAVSEIGLSNDVIKQRSRKLIFIKPKNLFLVVTYLAFTVFLIAQLVAILIMPNLVNLENMMLFYMVVVIDLISLLGISYWKTSLYIESLLEKYKNITIKNKNTFKRENYVYKISLF